MKKKDAIVNKIVTFITLTSVLLVGVTVAPQEALSLSMSASPSSGLSHTGTPFGGIIAGEIQCQAVCGTPWKMIYMYDFVTHGQLRLTIEPGKSMLYKYVQNFTPGRYALGTYSRPAQCKIKPGKKCIDLMPHGYINKGPGAGASGPLSQ